MRTGSARIPERLFSRAVRRVAAIALALAVIQTAACRDKDVVTASYVTMAEAREAGAAGWEIPAGMPEGAHDIRLARDMDSGRHWGLFNFHPEDAAGLRALLQSEETPLDGVECDIPPRIEWWPILLRGPVKAEQARAAGLHSYRSREGGLIVVVNWKQGRAYYWKA